MSNPRSLTAGSLEQSGVTLEQIVGAVKKVTDIVAEIAALVEQASAASQSMADGCRYRHQ
jgi:methyl-accepting chemotaxis protein